MKSQAEGFGERGNRGSWGKSKRSNHGLLQSSFNQMVSLIKGIEIYVVAL